jgi:hypothetical protein
MLLELGWENHSERREKARLCGLHKRGHEGWAEMGAGIERNLSQRHGLNLRERGVKTKAGRNSFLSRTITEWNRLVTQQKENIYRTSSKMFMRGL